MSGLLQLRCIAASTTQALACICHHTPASACMYNSFYRPRGRRAGGTSRAKPSTSTGSVTRERRGSRMRALPCQGLHHGPPPTSTAPASERASTNGCPFTWPPRTSHIRNRICQKQTKLAQNSPKRSQELKAHRSRPSLLCQGGKFLTQGSNAKASPQDKLFLAV